MGGRGVRVGGTERQKEPHHVVVVLGRRAGAAGDPIEDVGIGAVEEGLVAVELSLVEHREMRVGEAAKDQIALAGAAVPGAEQQPLAANVG